MKAAWLALSSALFAPCATAQEVDWHRAILAAAEARAALILQGQAIDRMIAEMHPEIAKRDAANLSVTVEEFEARVRSGYAMSASMLKIVDKTVIPEAAIFGTVGPIKWGIVPDVSQAQMVGSDAPLPERCGVVLFFGSEEKWFVHSLSGKGFNERLLAALPELVALPLDTLPDCGQPIS